MENGISVIMISYLSDYHNSRKYPKEKFIRAVTSFINQTHQKKELIIVSDGCQITNDVYDQMFKDRSDIQLVKVEKQKSKWPGKLRECGRSMAKYDWITYLDSDDMILSGHLSEINSHINNINSVIFNKRIMFPLIKDAVSEYFNVTGLSQENLDEFLDSGKSFAYSKCAHCRGTWQITHKSDIEVRWNDSDLRGEDSQFIEDCKKKYDFIEYDGYYVICHYVHKGNVIWEI